MDQQRDRFREDVEARMRQKLREVEVKRWLYGKTVSV